MWAPVAGECGHWNTAGVETAWIYEHLAVTVADLDFLDPAGNADDRERGVRVELRPVTREYRGSIYASPVLDLRPAVCRIDLLESAPGAADRMHWHPVMDGGEPGDRTFDEDLALDPLAWVASHLAEADGMLQRAGYDDLRHGAQDLDALAADVPDIVVRIQRGLETTRQAWPNVDHDERGLAPVSPTS